MKRQEQLEEQVRKQTAELRKSEERLELALEGADLGLWDWDIQTGDCYFNERWLTLLGYAPGDIEPHVDSWKQILHPDDAPRVMETVQKSLDGELLFYECEFRLRAKSGQWQWVLARGKVVERAPDGQPLRYTGTHQDIDEKKRFEEELISHHARLESLVAQRTAELSAANDLLKKELAERKEVEEEYKATIHTSIDGFWVYDIQGHFLEVNDAYCALSGYSREELLTMRIPDVEDIECPEDTARRIKKITEEGGDRFETRHRRKDGKILDIEVATTYNGQFYAFLRDITKRKQTKRKLSETAYAMGERVKELNCLYGIAALVEDRSNAFEYIVQGAVNLIPSSWQYPDITCAQAIIEGKIFQSDRFTETPWKQSANIHVNEELVGVLEVYYTEETSPFDEGPFLKEERHLINAIAERLGRVIERTRVEKDLKQIEWLLSQGIDRAAPPVERYHQPYGDLTKLNTSRTLLDSVGQDSLADIMGGILDLLDTSGAVYEKNGDYALGMFASGWCRFLDQASRDLCDTEDNSEALTCGKWLCHESCWNDAAKAAIDTGLPADIECNGGLRLFAVPVWANGEIAGAVNFGHGNPPTDPEQQQEIAEKYHVAIDDLREAADECKSRPPFLVNLAKNRLLTAARLIGEICERKRAEEKLAEHSDHLEELVESRTEKLTLSNASLIQSSSFLSATGKMAKVGGWALDLAANELQWTDETKRIHEVPKDYIPTLNKALDFYIPEDRSKITQVVQRAIDHGEPFDLEVRLLTAKGKTIWAHSIGEAHQVDGKTVKLTGTFQDITERKQAEEALEKSEERFKAMFANMSSGVAVYEAINDGEDFRFVDFNPAGERIDKVSREELVGKTLLEKFPGMDEFGLPSVLRRVWKTGEPEHFPVAVYADARHQGWRENFIYKLPSGEVIAIYDDVTERMQAEEKLKASEKQLRTWLQYSPMCTKIVDLDFNLQFMSESGVRDLNIDDITEWYGKPYPFEFYPESFKKLMTKSLQKVKETGETATQEGSVVDTEGCELWFHSTLVPVNNDEGQLDYIMVVSMETTDRKRAEEALRESETKYRTFFENSGDAMLIIRDHEFIDCNASALAMFGHTEKEALFKIHPSDVSPEFQCDGRRSQEKAEEMMNLALSEGTLRFEWEHRRKNGDIFPAEISLTAIPLGDEVVLHVVCRDITERRQAEEALRQSEEKHRELTENLPQGIFHKDANLYYVSCNKRFADDLGVTPDEIAGKNDFDFHPKELAEKYRADDRRVMESGQTEEIEEINIRSDEEFIVHTVKTPLTDEAGNATGILGIFWDITERKRTEKALREASEFREKILSESPIGAAIYDAESGQCLAANKSMTELVGASIEQMLAQNFRDIESWKKSGLFETAQSALDENTKKHLEVKVTTTFGKEITVDCYFSPFIAGEKKYLLATILDICERKEAEKEQVKLEGQLRQSQKMEAVGQLAGGIAHDFNNLLQAILGYSDIALDEVGAGDPVRDSIEQILKAGNRAKTLVRQLLAFSRRQVLEMQDIDLNDVVADLSKMIRRVIGEHIGFHIFSGHDLGTVRADRGQLEQILMNLSVNARDAMPDGGTITVETENVRIDQAYCDSHPWAKQGRYALLSVTDTGCGMSQEVLKQVFEPFFTTKGVGEGTGLGLATVYGLVRQHKGFVHVYSEVDKGTTFKIYLPLVERCAATVGDKIEGAVPGGTETILLAEDDEMVCKLTKSILEYSGYTVLAAADGEEALREFDAHADEIDLALLDVMMPKLGGRGVFEHIRKTHPEVRTLFASGYSMNAIHTNFVLDEGLALIQKPYQRNDLLRKVREVLDSEK